jgi:hypothetical protein
VPLSFHKLQLPDAEETIAFRAVDKILKHDIVLKHVLKTYNSFTGSTIDLLTPTPAMCPYVQISPKPMQARWESEGEHRAPLTILILCAVEGSNADNLMNLFGCVRRALWPMDPAKKAEVDAIKNATPVIMKATLSLAGFGVIPLAKGSSVIGAAGHLELLLHVPTP